MAKRTPRKPPRLPSGAHAHTSHRSADPAQTSADVLARCRALGFALAGIAPGQPSAYARELREWMAAGKHGSMEYFADAQANATREDPRGILDFIEQDGQRAAPARAFIVVADQYATRGVEPSMPAPGWGAIARYARGRNYHEVVKRRLHALADDLRTTYPGHEFRSCVDTAPILERELAVLAGLGWQAKNTMVIHPRLGSWFFLGVVATDLDIAPTPSDARVPESCGTCTRCIDACPTRAITPFSVDASRCISYLTIERRQSIAPDFHAAMGHWLLGCDICQEVCPHNSLRPEGTDLGVAHPAYAPVREGFDLLEVLGWSEGDRREAFTNSAMKRATLDMMKRNALIVAGNAIAASDTTRPLDPRLKALRDRIAQAATDPSEPALVRQTAADVLASLATQTHRLPPGHA